MNTYSGSGSVPVNQTPPNKNQNFQGDGGSKSPQQPPQAPNNLPIRSRPTSSDIKVIPPQEKNIPSQPTEVVAPKEVAAYKPEPISNTVAPTGVDNKKIEVLPQEYRGQFYAKTAVVAKKAEKPKSEDKPEVKKDEPESEVLKPNESLDSTRQTGSLPKPRVQQPVTPTPNPEPNTSWQKSFSEQIKSGQVQKKEEIKQQVPPTTPTRPEFVKEESKQSGTPKPKTPEKSNKYLITLLLVVASVVLVLANIYFKTWQALPFLATDDTQPSDCLTIDCLDDIVPGDLDEPAIPDEPIVIDEPVTEDTDEDGLSDVEELNLGTDPNNPDTDGDSMPDGWEQKFGLKPLSPSDAEVDMDADGLSNKDEFLFNTEPDNEDTDGDSFKDGLEIKSGYSPLSGPGILLEENSPQPQIPITLEEDIEEVVTQQDTVSGRDAKRKIDAKLIELALELYYDDNNQIYPDSLDKLVPSYVKSLPQDPLVGQYDYSYVKLSDIGYELKIYIETENDEADLSDGVADHFYTITIGVNQ